MPFVTFWQVTADLPVLHGRAGRTRPQVHDRTGRRVVCRDAAHRPHTSRPGQPQTGHCHRGMRAAPPVSPSSFPLVGWRRQIGLGPGAYSGRVADERAAEVALNRALWRVLNERFTDAAADALWSRTDVVWGLFAVPDRLLGAVGDVRDLDVLEMASGTAYFSAWLTRAGARAVALDLSAEQLATAQDLQRRVGPAFPLVQADAERIPLASGRFDLVVSEHGVAAWCDPERWLPEAARLLRPGGGWSSSPTVFCRRSVSPPMRGSPRIGSYAASGTPTKCAGREAGWSSTPHTVTGCGCSAAADSPSRPCTRSTRLWTPSTIRSTRSCRPSGRHAGRPRNCGWHGGRSMHRFDSTRPGRGDPHQGVVADHSKVHSGAAPARTGLSPLVTEGLEQDTPLGVGEVRRHQRAVHAAKPLTQPVEVALIGDSEESRRPPPSPRCGSSPAAPW